MPFYRHKSAHIQVIRTTTCRWYKKRMKKYACITSAFDDATMRARRDTTDNGTSNDVVPPLLPSLAASASSAVLRLSVYNGQGKQLPWQAVTSNTTTCKQCTDCLRVVPTSSR